MIKKYSLLALQRAIQYALSNVADLSEKLMPLENKVVCILVRPLSVKFFMQFQQGQICLLDTYDAEPDTTIYSSPLGLIRLSLLPASKVRSLFHDGVQISGDLLLGQQIKTIFDALEIDWEGHVAQFTGDVIAHQLGRAVRRGLRTGAHCRTTLQTAVTEHLQEELRVLPSAEAITDFFNDVDALALRVARLEANIQQKIS